ncbi:hypothetical protein B0I37DRAFT_25447 [Chaetomium sp. MPI-CAGE-AT-0009]|nr:hypothetical protein B0I37DRAFT_25447 [Chaetomium sp. MPI-CAGE-AT-0009]
MPFVNKAPRRGIDLCFRSTQKSSRVAPPAVGPAVNWWKPQRHLGRTPKDGGAPPSRVLPVSGWLPCGSLSRKRLPVPTRTQAWRSHFNSLDPIARFARVISTSHTACNSGVSQPIGPSRHGAEEILCNRRSGSPVVLVFSSSQGHRWARHPNFQEETVVVCRMGLVAGARSTPQQPRRNTRVPHRQGSPSKPLPPFALTYRRSVWCFQSWAYTVTSPTALKKGVGSDLRVWWVQTKEHRGKIGSTVFGASAFWLRPGTLSARY